MLRHASVSLEMAWNTWSDRPAEMVFLPLGVRLTPVAYAASTGRATLFPPGDSVRLGRHAVDGAVVELRLRHAGTEIDWHYMKAGPFDLMSRWTTSVSGEWGLRFWINLCVSAEGGESVRYDPARRAAVLRIGHRFVAVVCGDDPVQVTGHANVDEVVSEYETKGYFNLASRATDAPLLALRFNLEMTRDGSFGVAIADREDLAVARATALIATVLPLRTLPTQTGNFAGSLDAIRDVMGWLTVWDEINQRPYTCISRNWNVSKFGGFGVWLDDQLYAALNTALFDQELGRQNIAVALAGATPQGNLPCLLTANDSWVDRTQIPVAAFVVWSIYLRNRSLPLLRMAFDTLVRNHAWWWSARDPESTGLASYGTSDVGRGLYKGTHFGARNESSMDNSPIHDEADYDERTRTLTTIDVGLNSMLALDAEMLGLIAEELGFTAQAAAYRSVAAGICERIASHLWDVSRSIFANRLRSGRFVDSVGPTSFYPLICGAASGQQARELLRHLANPATFGGKFVIPGTPRDDPAARDNVYWRGRIWPPLNFNIWQGLRRYGFDAEASSLARVSTELFRRAWECRQCPENYNAETGEPLDQPDTDAFYAWGALMPLLGVSEIMNFSPWNGWEITNAGGQSFLGPLDSPVGAVCIAIVDGRLSLSRGDMVFLETDVAGRFEDLRWTDRLVSVRLPKPLLRSGVIRFAAIAPDRVMLARIGQKDAVWISDGSGIAIEVMPEQQAQVLTLVVRS